jgi:hypothetical protein
VSILKDRVLNWYATGRTGVSSEAMANTVCDIECSNGFANHPHDPSDFNRCLLFLEAVPEAKLLLSKVAEISPVWKRLVERWDEIESMLIGEVGHNWSKGRSAPKTYELMREIIEQ